MQCFFIPASHIGDGRATLTEEAARQLTRVLRARVGDCVVALDGSGDEYVVRLDTLSDQHASGAICERRSGLGEPDTHITLYQGLLKADKLEYALQKGTELGVSRFAPLVFERSVRRNMPSANRMQRWRRIIREAAEQSGRSRLPTLADATPFDDTLDNIEQPALLAWECESATGLRDALLRLKASSDADNADNADDEGGGAVRRIGIIVGSEGGVTDAEAAQARERGIATVSLGRRVLRAETAGVIAAAAVLYEFGDLGQP